MMTVFVLVTHVTARPCLHTVGMDSDSFNPKKIVSLKSVDDDKEYPKEDRLKLLPTARKGVPLKKGETEVKIVTDKRREQDVGVVKLIVKKEQLGNIKRVVLLAERPGEREPTVVEEYDTKDLEDVKGNLLEGKNPIKTKAVTIRITKKKNRRVNLKVNIKICVKTTTGESVCVTILYDCKHDAYMKVLFIAAAPTTSTTTATPVLTSTTTEAPTSTTTRRE